MGRGSSTSARRSIPAYRCASFLQNTMDGFFADPIYRGNKDMVS
jgi:hypothetical protein